MLRVESEGRQRLLAQSGARSFITMPERHSDLLPKVLCSVSLLQRTVHAWCLGKLDHRAGGAMQRKEALWAEERDLGNRMGLDSSYLGVVTFSVTFTL